MLKLLKAVRSEKGFTLIELLVVIGILAVLAGVVTLAVTQFIGRGADEANCVELHNVQTAAAAALADGKQASQYTAYLLTTPKCTYTVADDGTVTQQSCPRGRPCLPAGGQ